MKTLLTIAFFLTSAAASADCPDLSGAFTCDTSQGSFDISVTQETTEEVTVYTLNDGTQDYVITSDNIEKPFEDKEASVTGSTRITCENAALTTYQKAQAVDQYGNVVKSIDFVETIQRDADQNLLVATVGVHTEGNETTPINESFTCKAAK